jgi:hypothetical protein
VKKPLTDSVPHRSLDPPPIPRARCSPATVSSSSQSIHHANAEPSAALLTRPSYCPALAHSHPATLCYMSARARARRSLCDGGISPTLASHPRGAHACAYPLRAISPTHPRLTPSLACLHPSRPPHHHPVTPARKHAHVLVPFMPSHLPTLACTPCASTIMLSHLKSHRREAQFSPAP